MKFLFSIFLNLSITYSAISQNSETKVLIKTNLGEITLKLYNETPIHRDNFVKLVNEGFYEGISFHRVIHQFMIQGGDPFTKDSTQQNNIGNGGPGYTLEAEIVPGLIHKKGALAAARLGDNVNPEKRSSGSQFYIVHGKIFSEQNLQMLTDQKNNQIKQAVFTEFLKDSTNREYKKRFLQIQESRNQEAYTAFINEITPMLNDIFDQKEKYQFTPQQIEAYTTIGGSPHLDGDYTVFGEVISGLDVVDAIAKTAVSAQNRPIKPVVIEKMKVVKN